MSAIKTLFVDDELWGVEHYLKHLKDMGRQVDQVRTYTDAIQKIEAGLEGYKSVVLDVRMSTAAARSKGVDFRSAGIRIYRLIRQRRQDIPVVILTNNFDQVPEDEIASDRYTRALDKSQTIPDQLWNALHTLEKTAQTATLPPRAGV
ncbi:MAG: response regulator [Bryobacterales bacterium]|nr:response regulator [Bryobacterales bacterium]